MSHACVLYGVGAFCLYASEQVAAAAPGLHPAAAHHVLLGTALHHFPGRPHWPLHGLLRAGRHGASAHATCAARAAAAARSSASARSACALGKRRGSEESKCSCEYNGLFHSEVLQLLTGARAERRARNLVRCFT